MYSMSSTSYEAPLHRVSGLNPVSEKVAGSSGLVGGSFGTLASDKGINSW